MLLRNESANIVGEAMWYEVENMSLVGWGQMIKHPSFWLVDELVLRSVGFKVILKDFKQGCETTRFIF